MQRGKQLYGSLPPPQGKTALLVTAASYWKAFSRAQGHALPSAALDGKYKKDHWLKGSASVILERWKLPNVFFVAPFTGHPNWIRT